MPLDFALTCVTVCFRLQIIISIELLIMPLLHALNLARAMCFRLDWNALLCHCLVCSTLDLEASCVQFVIALATMDTHCLLYLHTLHPCMANNCARASGTCSPKFLLFVLHDYFYVPEFYFKSSKSHTYESLLNKHYKA